MDAIASHLLESCPTVLQITGFTPEATAALRSIFNESLQQPSYVSMAVITGGDEGNRERRASRVVLACPLGLGLKITFRGEAAIVEELSSCCLGEINVKGLCGTCKTMPMVVPLTSI